ncbi:ATP-binding protein [Tepidibacter hydrothermalis]|uniref:histidine kinase n=1 Tax=Tepidibacter hydrothermalis TaxID=3036126 RepID=A0ABY8EAB2_9FIRM|nr:ATP-binding protein [Tepidibacter hydrothermalis]WFD09876.1 ATP-binding protein [Tepidibacter hydrothermalis]
MTNKNKFWCLFISILLSNMLFLCNFYSFAEEKMNHILIINSQNMSIPYTHDVVRGIYSNLRGKNNIIHVENMDIQIKPDHKYFDTLYNLYKYKFKNYNFDIIIATDEDAYYFFEKYGDNLFENSPILFCGINEPSILNKIQSNKRFYVVEQSIDIEKTLNLANKIHPNNTIFIPVDPKLLSSHYMKLLNNQKKYYKDKGVDILIYYESNINKVLDKMNTLKPDLTLITLTEFKTDNNDNYYMNNLIQFASNKKNIPSYSFWSSMISTGIIGGSLCDAYDLGNTSGRFALKIMKNPKYDVHKVSNKNKYMFDYNQLTKFNIPINNLPLGSKIKNKPSNFYSISKDMIYAFAVYIILLLILVIFILLVNINKIKKLQKILKSSTEDYKNLIEFLPFGILVHDKGNILFANSAFLKLFRYKDLDSIRNTSLYNYIHKDFHEKIKERLEDQQKNIYSPYIEELGITSDGELIDIEVCAYPSSDDKNYTVAVVNDLIEKRKAEKLKNKILEEEKRLKQALEYDKLKTEFFSNLSHELKTPLNLIFSITQLIESNLKNDQLVCTSSNTSHHINILKQNCYRMLRLVNNLIDITKLDCGYFNIELQNHNIVSLVENITLSVSEYIKNKQISLIFDTNVEEKIMAVDPNAIERIILNLLSNAIKFTDSGDSIIVDLLIEEEYVTISIKDTGIGIPKDKLKIIFDRFRQVDKSLTRNREGSGIGLSLVKSLIDMHNGSIDVKSDYGYGSEFIIKLPVTTVDNINKVDSVYVKDKYIEKINIEFSDIYSI